VIAIAAARHAVIPAKAGIHFALHPGSKVKMGPGFRRDDKFVASSSAQEFHHAFHS